CARRAPRTPGPGGVAHRARPARTACANGRGVRGDVRAGPGGAARPGTARHGPGDVDSDVDVDRGRNLAVVAGIPHYVSLPRFVPRDDDPRGRGGGADAR